MQSVRSRILIWLIRHRHLFKLQLKPGVVDESFPVTAFRLHFHPDWCPSSANATMGNVIVTSVGMMGRISGWFIHKSVHPLSFGIGSILEKPWVVDGEIRVREILNMTVLIDHDFIDGAPMARFVQKLTRNLESGMI